MKKEILGKKERNVLSKFNYKSKFILIHKKKKYQNFFFHYQI